MRRATPLLVLVIVAARAHASLLPGAEGGRSAWLALVQREASLRGVPPALADAVAMVETGYRPDAVGSSGEIGMMQIMPATARQLGFNGTLEELWNPTVNIHLAVDYLGRAWAAGGGNLCRVLMKYRAGLGQEFMTPLSVRYCARAMGWLASTGNTDLTRSTPLPEGITLPPPPADPYVIAVVPALLAQNNGHPILATAHELIANYRYHRSMADRNAALQARFDSHMRHMPHADTASEAVAAALAAPDE